MLCLLLALPSIGMEPDKIQHGLGGIALTCFFKDHGFTAEESFVNTLLILIAWEVIRGYNSDSNDDLLVGITGSLISLVW